MGNCCVSSTAGAPSRYSHFATDSKQRITTPPPLEEETVKEVLSETPALPIDNGPRKHPPLTREQGKHQNGGVLMKKPPAAVMDFNPDELSEDFSASEICSDFSENFPTSTLTGKADREGDVRQRSQAKIMNRQFPGQVRKARSVGNSPSRRPVPSPGGVRSVAGGRDSSRRSPAKGPRKENYENAGRRSMSPATRAGNGGARTGLGRSPSVRKTGKDPGRVRSDMREKNGREKRPSTNSNELLENPLVSLECFIFL